MNVEPQIMNKYQQYSTVLHWVKKHTNMSGTYSPIFTYHTELTWQFQQQTQPLPRLNLTQFDPRRGFKHTECTPNTRWQCGNDMKICDFVHLDELLCTQTGAVYGLLTLYKDWVWNGQNCKAYDTKYLQIQTLKLASMQANIWPVFFIYKQIFLKLFPVLPLASLELQQKQEHFGSDPKCTKPITSFCMDEVVFMQIWKLLEWNGELKQNLVPHKP